LAAVSPAADIGVVGAGIVGLSAAYAVAQRGASVTVYERGVPGNGQSGGDSRIFRHTHDDPRLIAFVRRSLSLWREWEARCGAELVSQDGVLSLGPGARERHAELVRHGVSARLVEPAEASSALPILAGREQSHELLLDDDGGVIRTRTAIEMLRAALVERIVFDEVLSVRPTVAGPVEVRRGDATTEHDRVLVCAGIGTAGLAHGVGVDVPLHTSLHVRLAFDVRAPAPPARLACLLDGTGDGGEHAYGDPLPGNGAYAVGVAEAAVHPDGGLVEPDGLATVARRTVDYARAMLPGVDPSRARARHCWVTELDWGPDAFALWTVGGAHFLAGQNLFKHAPGIGEALAATALGEPAAIDLSPDSRLGRAAR
jgi:glycine/D-amino acid oxidase-like deaminating enzyme